MATARGFEHKGDLTPEEKLKVAYFHLLRGIAQHTLADMFDVNGGRVAEAITEVRKAVGMKINEQRQQRAADTGSLPGEV